MSAMLGPEDLNNAANAASGGAEHMRILTRLAPLAIVSGLISVATHMRGAKTIKSMRGKLVYYLTTLSMGVLLGYAFLLAKEVIPLIPQGLEGEQFLAILAGVAGKAVVDGIASHILGIQIFKQWKGKDRRNSDMN